LSSPRLSWLGRMGAQISSASSALRKALHRTGILVLRPEEPMFFANAQPLLAVARRRVVANKRRYAGRFSVSKKNRRISTTRRGNV